MRSERHGKKIPHVRVGVRMERMDREITQIVRELALREGNKKSELT